MSKQPSLCYDVLTLLYSLLDDRACVWSLMCTSRDHYDAGVGRLLTFPVEIKSDVALESFCRFMQQDITRRSGLLHELAICVHVARRLDKGALEGHTVHLILQAAKRLESLKIFYLEDLMVQNARYADVLSELTSLRRFHAVLCGARTLSELIPRIPQNIVEINIDFWFEQSTSDPSLVSVLAPFEGTLEKATVYGVDISATSMPSNVRIPCFSRVRTLSVGNFRKGIHAPLLVQAFPNLCALDLTDMILDPGLFNTTEHQRNHALLSGHQPKWPSLVHIGGDVDALHALGLTQWLHRADISGVTLTSDVDLLWTVAWDLACPDRLLIHFEFGWEPEASEGYGLKNGDGDEDEDDTAEVLRSLFSNMLLDTTGCVNYLALDFCSTFVERGPMDPDVFYAMLSQALNDCLFLTFLIVRIQPTELAEDPRDDDDDPRASPVDDAQYAATYRWFEQYARGLAEALAALEFISFDVVGLPHPVHWRVIRVEKDDTVVGLEPVSQTEAGRLTEAQDMQWFRRRRFRW